MSWNREDLTGKRFGKLVVIGVASTRKSENRKSWECLCDCGNRVVVLPYELRGGKITSCKCNQYKKLPKGEAAFRLLYRGYIHNAEMRDLSFDLSADQFRNLVTGKCFYCGRRADKVIGSDRNNGKFHYIGLDRVDNLKGYSISNCVPCCFSCNQTKGYITVEILKKSYEFLFHP